MEGGERSGTFALSPDEERMAIARTASGNSDIWMIDLRRGVSSRFTTAASIETHPVFSADGSRLIAAAPVSIVVVQNFTEELKQRVRPSGR